MEIKILKNINDSNDAIAKKNKEYFNKNNIYAINIMGSPGAGKTAFIETMLKHNKNNLNFAVIEGDLATTNDSERIAKYNVPAVQINTLEATSVCHLHANMVHHCLKQENFKDMDILIIENVGNLVCPSYYSLGEDIRVVVLSVTEGEDKPIKYPKIFNIADIIIISKVDLIPHLDINMKEIYSNLEKVSPNAKIIEFTKNDNLGIQKWYELIKQSQNHINK